MNKSRRAGLIGENLAIAADVLKTHKLRSGLIILGVAIGVAMLMSMVSILLGLQESITGEINSSEQTSLIVQKYSFLVGGMDESMRRRRDITENDARAIREQCPSLKQVAFTIEPQGLPQTLRYKEEKSRMVQLMGSQPSLLYVMNLDLDDGRMFTEAEVLHSAKVVVLSNSPKRDLFPNIDPIGKKVRIGNDDFTIVGTFAKRKSLGGDSDENFAMMPNTTYKSTLWKEGDRQIVTAIVRDGFSLEAARDEVIRVMRIQRKLKANQNNDFEVTSSDAALDLISRVTTPIALILTAISSIALLVGGIGVMNIMLVSVTERTTEIGIRKAVGAVKKDIMWQFLIEAGVVTGLGGIIGIIIGLSIAFIVSRLTGMPFSLSPFYILLAVSFSVAIGMFFGLYPAHRASKLNPIKAISYAK
jgi:putative ABC transport system permease protein